MQIVGTSLISMRMEFATSAFKHRVKDDDRRFAHGASVPRSLGLNDPLAVVVGEIPGHQRLAQNVTPSVRYIREQCRSSSSSRSTRPSAGECQRQYDALVDSFAARHPKVWDQLGARHRPIIRDTKRPPSVVHIGDFGVISGNPSMPQFHV